MEKKRKSERTVEDKPRPYAYECVCSIKRSFIILQLGRGNYFDPPEEVVFFFNKVHAQVSSWKMF